MQKKLVEKYKDNFREKLGKNDRLNVKPISLTVDPEKLAAHKPTTHLKPYDVPYHLRQGFESKLLNMLNAEILEQCDSPGWDETRFLGRDRDRVIRGVEFLYETETEKFYLEDYSTRPRPRNSIYKFFVRDETETRLD